MHAYCSPHYTRIFESIFEDSIIKMIIDQAIEENIDKKFKHDTR